MTIAFAPAHMPAGLLRTARSTVRPLLYPLASRLRTFLMRDVLSVLAGLRAAQAGMDASLAQQHAALAMLSAHLTTPPPPPRVVRAVHQFHAGSATGDAITNAMLLIQSRLRALGYDSEIYVEHLGAGLEHRLRGIDALPTDPDHVLLVHHSMGHDGFDRVLASPGRKLLIYHNITPPELLAHNPYMQRAAERGRAQLAVWRHHVVAAMADSAFNGHELRRLGFACVREATLLFDTHALRERAGTHGAAHRDIRKGGAYTVLFVGRVAPSKGQVQLVEAFAAFSRMWAHGSQRPVRLVLAGAHSPCCAEYRREIEDTIHRHGLDGAVTMTGKLSDSDLSDWYGRADLYVSLSRHEGFGVPLVEAMAYGLPVIALDAGAVADTLGCGGVLLARTGDAAAAMLHLAQNPDSAGDRAARQARMLDKWSLARHLPVLDQMLALAGAMPPEQRAPDEFAAF